MRSPFEVWFQLSPPGNKAAVAAELRRIAAKARARNQ